jgi:CBS domain-containing protein
VTTADGELVGIVSRSDLLTAFLRPDDEIRAGIESALTEPRPSIEEGQIDVLVEDGVAKLEGRVAYKSQIPRVVSVARTIDGVVDVVSRLEYEVDDVGPEKSGPQPCAHAAAGGDDTWRSLEA